MKSCHLNIRIEPETKKRLNELAKIEHRNMSLQARWIIEKYFDGYLVPTQNVTHEFTKNQDVCEPAR